MKPAFRASAGTVRVKTCKALATATGSSRAMMNPVGPVRWGWTAASSDDAMARRASRFFTTLYSADTARSCRRSSDSCCTVSPRYSVRNTELAPCRRVWKSWTVVIFSCVGTLSLLVRLLLELVADALGVHLDPGPHGGGDDQRSEIGALRGRRLGAHDRLDDGHGVGQQLIGRE